MSSQTKKIVLLTLGDELLLGLTANTHLTFIGEQLRLGGALLHANITLSDAAGDIAQHFNYYWEQADILITTGGLGPTVDDRTREIIAETLGERLVFDEEIMATITQFFAERGREVTANNRKQAYRFEQGEVLPNPHGTAPGLYLERDGKALVMLPGPPNELKPMWLGHVLPRFRAKGWLEEEENFLQIRTIGIGESALETKLQPLLDLYPRIDVAYCAHLSQVDFRLSKRGCDDSEILELAAKCKEALGLDFLCFGQDDLTKVVSDIIKRQKMTLSTAESCTGGLVANAFTDVPGASEFFQGGMVCYNVNAKLEVGGVPEEMVQQHSPVSAEVAMAMATGVAEKMESNFAIATTGYAGPGGGDPLNPVGTVYIGLYSPRGTWAKRVFFRGSRAVVKNRVMVTAIDWLRRELLIERELEEDENLVLRQESQKILRSLK